MPPAFHVQNSSALFPHQTPIPSLLQRSLEDVRALLPMDDPLAKLPFVHETLSTLRGEVAGSGATLLGFVGTPWTLAAYSIEGKADRNCRRTKTMMFNSPQVLHALLDHLTEALIAYVGYQIDAGAQVGTGGAKRGCGGGGFCRGPVGSGWLLLLVGCVPLVVCVPAKSCIWQLLVAALPASSEEGSSGGSPHQPPPAPPSSLQCCRLCSCLTRGRTT